MEVKRNLEEYLIRASSLNIITEEEKDDVIKTSKIFLDEDQLKNIKTIKIEALLFGIVTALEKLNNTYYEKQLSILEDAESISNKLEALLKVSELLQQRKDMIRIISTFNKIVESPEDLKTALNNDTVIGKIQQLDLDNLIEKY
jgi:hypothetical protein